MSRARLVRCACGAERVREIEVWRVDEVTGAVVHVEAFAGSVECAHAAGECVRHEPDAALPWLVIDPCGSTRLAACPAWARGYMGRA